MASDGVTVGDVVVAVDSACPREASAGCEVTSASAGPPFGVKQIRTACSHLVAAAIGAVIALAIAFTVMMTTNGGGGGASPPIKVQCGACDGKVLEGTFRGEGVQHIAFVTMKWVSTATFNSTSKTAKWVQTPQNDPLHLQPTFSCPGVPTVLDNMRCNLTSVDQCIESVYTGGLHLISDSSVWDGKDSIVKTTVIRAPIVGTQRVTFTLTRIPDEIPGDSVNAQFSADSLVGHASGSLAYSL